MSNIKKNDIKVIFSDLFGVLVGPDYSEVLTYVQDVTQQSFDIVYQQVFDDDSMHLIRGEISFEAFFTLLQYKIINGDLINFKKFKSHWIKMQIGEMPTVQHLLEKNKTYAICIITNTTSSHINQLKLRYNFFNSFNGIVTSDQSESHKPNPKIFNYACSLFNINPHESIFIDDNEANVIAACNLGMIGHHYKNHTSFLQFIW